MPPAFTIGAIIGPVAVATVLNVFAFAWAWRAHRDETRTGIQPWHAAVVLPAYLLPIGAFLYLTQDKPITTPLQVFVGAMSGEMMGAGVVYMLLNAFLWTRGQPIRERIAPMIGSLFLLAVMLSVTLG